MVTKEITKELVEQQMNSTLSYFPWGGKVIAVRQNQWGEWIVDCKIPGHYSREWGEKHQQMLEGELHIAIINTDSISPEVGIIKVKWGWLRRDLPQWLIDNGHYDYFYEIPDDEDELIEHFLFVYCDYSQSNLHWQCVPPDTQFKRLTIKDFQK